MAQTLITNNCPDEPYNPKDVFNRHKKRLTNVRFADLDHPVPGQVVDTGDLKKFFQVYKDVFIPYSGTGLESGQSLLHFLITLKELSPTQGAVIEDMKRHYFGGRVAIEYSQDPVFDLGEDDLGEPSFPEKEAFKLFLEQIEFYGVDEMEVDVREFAKNWLESMKTGGNFYVELVRSEMPTGQRFFKAFQHMQEHCLYTVTEPGEDRVIAISKKWDVSYLEENPPEFLPLWPVWKRDGAGFERTILHWKNGNYPYYGRPDSVASVLDQFFEYQSADYKGKSTRNMFMGHSLIEVEDEGIPHGLSDEDSVAGGFESFVDEVEENFSNKSNDPQSLMIMTRPKGSAQAFVFQFRPNTNEKWFEYNEQRAEDNIIKSHGWSRRILGLDVASGLSSNVYMDEYEILAATVIKSGQNAAAAVISFISNLAAEWFGMPDMVNYSVKFTSPYAEIIAERRAAELEQQTGDEVKVDPSKDNPIEVDEVENENEDDNPDNGGGSSSV